jgi:hypothetical protein
MIRRPGIVGIEECDPVRLCAEHRHVARGVTAGTRFRPAQDLQPLVAMAHDLVEAAIGRGIVDHEDLSRGLGLGKNGIERALDVRALVVERNDDGETGHAAII